VTAARGDAGDRTVFGDAPDGVDGDRHALDRKVQRYMRDHNLDDYMDALEPRHRAGGQRLMPAFELHRSGFPALAASAINLGQLVT
jgi:hypothetical protein